MLKLVGFQVTNFRSVDDSGWIEIGDVTALIGTNESGKTNLLLPLWKLNPAKNGEINPMTDFPRKRYNEIRSMEEKPTFIRANFEIPPSIAAKIASITGSTEEQVKIVEVSRDFGGYLSIEFPNANPKRYVAKTTLIELLSTNQSKIEAIEPPTKIEESFKDEVLKALAEALETAQTANEDADSSIVTNVKKLLDKVDTNAASKRSIISPLFGQALDALEEIIQDITKPHPSRSKEVKELITKHLPVFVYYSNYGNLDSEIYLPHVIENIDRKDLGSKEEAKVRTLKVLFEFVKLNPKEILELGKEYPAEMGAPSEKQIREIAEKKKERDILLQSAGTELTEKFRTWWQQGEYRFRFQADGNHFRIWVSDDKRPEEIELEGRSTGLQWFLSFYLIFLVESMDTHKGAILLLDEPGMTLHPIAQKDLSNFFANLSQTNQLVYTTHSPFLVDSDHLDQVKAVFVNRDGTTSVSANLRAGEKNPAQTKSIYPVHAALGLSVSETLFHGCQAVVVEGASDQHYLSTIKNYLIGKGLIMPSREILFVPAGGVKGVCAVISLLTATDEVLPFVLLDSDASGQNMAKQLSSNLYSGYSSRILKIGDIRKMENAEIEDLFPDDFLAKIIEKLFFRDIEDEFTEEVEKDKPIVPQVQKFAEMHGIVLEQGWKVKVATQTKTRL